MICRRYTISKGKAATNGPVIARFWTAKSAAAFTSLMKAYGVDVRLTYKRRVH